MDKVIDIEERIPSLREKRRRRTNRNFLFLLVLFLLILAILLYLQSPLSKVTEIRVEGAGLHTEEEYIRASGLLEGEPIWGFSASDAEQSIAELPGVKETEVTRDGLRSVGILVKEWDTTALIERKEGFQSVLANGEVFPEPLPSPPAAPILSGFGEGRLMERMVGQLTELPEEVTALISELKYTGEGEEDLSITAYMTDGYEVRGLITGFADKMEYYPSIISQLTEEGKGVLDLEVGLIFRSYEDVYGSGDGADGEPAAEEQTEEEIETP